MLTGRLFIWFTHLEPLIGSLSSIEQIGFLQTFLHPPATVTLPRFLCCATSMWFKALSKNYLIRPLGPSVDCSFRQQSLTMPNCSLGKFLFDHPRPLSTLLNQHQRIISRYSWDSIDPTLCALIYLLGSA